MGIDVRLWKALQSGLRCSNLTVESLSPMSIVTLRIPSFHPSPRALRSMIILHLLNDHDSDFLTPFRVLVILRLCSSHSAPKTKNTHFSWNRENTIFIRV